MSDLAQNIRFALRALRRTPGLTVVVTLTLALGVGAATAIFAVTNSVIGRPLPYEASSRLVGLFDTQQNVRDLPVSYPEYLDWKQRLTTAFSNMGVVIRQGEVLSGSGDAEQLQGAMVSVDIPAMLGLAPIIGRAFRPDDEGPGAPHVVVLGERLWRSRFAADPAIVGRTITLTGQPTVIVGVFPSSPRAVIPSRLPISHGEQAEFWRPLNLTTKDSPRGLHYLDVVARLRPGVTTTAAARTVETVASALQREGVTKHGIDLEPLEAWLVGDLRTPLRLILAAATLLLVIACANVANLLLARSTARRREFAVRAALGGGRARLVWNVLQEGTARALVGGACGVGVAYAVVAVARRLLASSVARMSEVTIDAHVLVAALAVSILAGLAIATLPALASSTDDLTTDLRDGSRGAGRGAGNDRVRRSLIVGEVALSFTLLTTGALLARSVHNLYALPMGFDPNRLVTARTWLPTPRYADSLSQLTFNERLLNAMGDVFGPGSVALTSSLPVEGGTSGTVTIEGRATTDDVPMVEKRVVSNSYFEVLKSRAIDGRLFRAGDVLSAPPVAVVNEAFVRRWFSTETPIGRRLSFDWGTSAVQTIVGVVEDVREGPLDAPPQPTVYVSAAQVPNSFMSIVVRTDRAAADVAAVYRRVLRRLDPALPVMDVRLVSDVISATMQQRMLIAVILASFATAALLLAGIGLYGVVSYSVAQRTHELGVRAAMGARASNLTGLVLRQGAAHVGAGIVIGVVLSLAARRLVATQLFGITGGDPWTMSLSAGVLALVAFTATAAPAVRVMHVDPLEALRAE